MRRRPGRKQSRSKGLANQVQPGTDAKSALQQSYQAGKQAAATYATEDAYKHFGKAVELAKSGTANGYWADSLEGLGQAALMLGHLDRAVESFVEAINALDKKDPKPTARLMKLRSQIAIAYERLGRYEDARHELDQGLALAGDGESAEIANLHGQVAVIHLRRGDLERAMEHATKDLAMAEEVEDEEEIGLACTILHRIHALHSDWENARHFAERALEIAIRREDIFRQEGNYLNLGVVFWSKGEWQESERNWRKALDICHTVHHTQGMIQNNLNLGCLSMHRGDLSQAGEFFDEALSLSREMGHLYYTARSTMRLAELSGLMGDSVKAAELFAEAERILRQLGNNIGLSELLWTMADHYAEQQSIDLAERAAEEAMALAPRGGSHEAIGNACRVLAKVHTIKGDRERARELLDESIGNLDRLGDVFHQAQGRTELASFLITTGSPADRVRATSLLEQSLQDFQRLGAVPYVARIQNYLQDLGGSVA